jgi:putative transcriptional regulator
MAHFHPDDALLTAYAAGTLPEPVMLVVATHLATCPDCCAVTADLLRAGGYCLNHADPVPVSVSCRERVLAAVRQCVARDESAHVPEFSAPGSETGNDNAVAAAGLVWPMPLRGYLARHGAEIPWKNRGFGIRQLAVPCETPNYECFVMDIAPGRSVPAHRHLGEEMVAVLRGAVLDPTGRFEAGDFLFADANVTHAQSADPEAGCVCLVVLGGGVSFQGRFGPVLNVISRVQKML